MIINLKSHLLTVDPSFQILVPVKEGSRLLQVCYPTSSDCAFEYGYANTTGSFTDLQQRETEILACHLR